MPAGSAITLRNSAEADIPTPGSGQITLFNDSDASNKPAYKDAAAAVHSLIGAPGADAPALTYQDHGNTGASVTCNATTANVHRLVLNAATVTFTFAGAPASGTPGLLRLRCIQDGTGGRLASWPGSVVWVAGVAPTLSTAAGAVDIIDFETDDGGTTWYGIVQGQRGAAGSAGTNGTAGGGVSIPYTFSTTTTDSDPGNGNLRLSNATQTSATVIRTDLLSSDGTDWSAILATLADSTNTIKGHIRLFKTSDPTKWLVFSVSSLASPSGYKNITVVNVAGSASSPFANSDAITLEFTRAGDVGASGTASVGTDPIWDAAGDLAVGTGADTAAKLTKGADGTKLTMVGGAVVWKGVVSCKAYHNTTQSISAGATASLALNSEDWDYATAVMHDTSTNNERLTVPYTGLYRLHAHVHTPDQSLNPGGAQIAAWLRLNGTSTLRGSSGGLSSTATGSGMRLEGNEIHISGEWLLTAGDYVDIQLYSQIAATVGHANAELQTTFSAVYLGPSA